MNRESANNQLSRLPIQMAGIVHAVRGNGISLPFYAYMVIPIAK